MNQRPASLRTREKRYEVTQLDNIDLEPDRRVRPPMLKHLPMHLSCKHRHEQRRRRRRRPIIARQRQQRLTRRGALRRRRRLLGLIRRHRSQLLLLLLWFIGSGCVRIGRSIEERR